ncbi:hypothetical protein CYL18_14325 [Pradoshia eiseniae]|uniref:site-specific DNA-methyltransferase (adenine-specific) n=1 Tax=Pradoshia eiseniae TaxID=2064768 RepID=A0A2S7MXC2_9BACI|nr:N-6 DNA methylase [Pradoshia eiseniae]PQD94388.1 hypothetical protein CYL18_14325 [Pradoshia eiseniae]
MGKEMNSREIYETIRRAGLSNSNPEEALLVTATILAVSKQNRSELLKLIQSQDVLEEIELMIKTLQIEDNFKRLMLEGFKDAFTEAYISSLVDVLLIIEQKLKNLTTGEVFDELLKSMCMDSREIFWTPNSINKIVNNYLFNQESSYVTFHDGTAGYGQSTMMFVKEVPSVSLALQEINPIAAAVLRIRLFLNDIDATVAVGDLIENPAYVDGNKLVQFDRVFMAPPFGLRLTEEQQNDMKYDQFNRFVYGIPSRSQGDLTFLSCGLSATKADGKAAFLLPMGVLFRNGPEKEIRQRLIDLDVIEAVVTLPPLLQPYSGIKTALVLCNKNKPDTGKGKILMINAEDLGEIVNKRDIILSAENIELINNILIEGLEVEEMSRFVMDDEIQSTLLTPNNYIYKEKLQVSEFGMVSININELDNLPMKPLKDLVDVYRGYNASTKDEDKNGKYAVLKISDIQDGKINLEGITRYSIKNNAKIENNRIRKGDVLLSIRGVSRKVALFESDRDDVLLSQNFAGIRCLNLIDPEFLLLYLESPIAQFYFNKHTAGTTITTLSIKDLKELPVPILPLDEQRRIVETLGDEQGEIKKEIERLEARQKESKLKAFEAMGINKTYTIL